MVTIKKIEIKDYFGCGNFEWNLDPVVNILGGKNGSGKSTLFKLCYTLLSSDKIDDKNDKFFSTLFEKVTISYNNGWALTWAKAGDNAEYSMNIGNSMVFRNNAAVLYDEKGNKISFSELQKQIQVYIINSFEQHTTKASQYEKQPKTKPLDDPTMLDLMIKDQIDIRNKDFSKVMEDIVDSPEEDGEKKRTEYVKIYKKIYSSLSHFLQGYDEPFKSSFEFTKNGNLVGYEHLSMGEKQILLLLLMVSNTQQQPCIFFMDEPDLSMHIDWKEILVKELHELNPNMQIILSTHAPSVITGWHDKVKEVNQLIKK